MLTRKQEFDGAHNAINRNVRAGKFPAAKTLTCKDCGKAAREYDHYAGYAKDNWFTVEPVCVSCHRRRTWLRGERKVTARMIKASTDTITKRMRAHHVGLCYGCFHPFKTESKTREKLFCSKRCSFKVRRILMPECMGNFGNRLGKSGMRKGLIRSQRSASR